VPAGAPSGMESGSVSVSTSPRCVRSCTFTGAEAPGRSGSGASTQARTMAAVRTVSSASTLTWSLSISTFWKSLPTSSASGLARAAAAWLPGCSSASTSWMRTSRPPDSATRASTRRVAAPKARS